MSHIPVNHPLRPLYRALAGIVGVYTLVIGVVGLTETAGDEMFGRSAVTVFGLPTNLAFSLLSIVAGVLVLGAALFGRNVDRFVNLWGGVAFMVAGTAMLAFLDTDLNKLNFSMASVIVSFVIGMVLFSAGLYGRSGSPAQARQEELVRHGRH